MRQPVEIDVGELFGERARLSELPAYERAVRERAGEGNDVVLTGSAPIWLYLRLAHALHGVARRLVYRSPVAGDVVVFDHAVD